MTLRLVGSRSLLLAICALILLVVGLHLVASVDVRVRAGDCRLRPGVWCVRAVGVDLIGLGVGRVRVVGALLLLWRRLHLHCGLIGTLHARRVEGGRER